MAQKNGGIKPTNISSPTDVKKHSGFAFGERTVFEDDFGVEGVC